jgi:hypothetical protein
VRVVVVVVVVVVIDTMTTTTTTMRISTRPPLTAASRQDTRTTPRHTHTRQCVYVCVFLCACACRWSSAPYLIHIGRLSGRLKRIYCSKGSQMYTKCARIHIRTHTHIYICVCVRVCACVRVCVRATRTKTMLYQRRAVLSYITTSHKMMMIERTARVYVYVCVWSILP